MGDDFESRAENVYYDPSKVGSLGGASALGRALEDKSRDLRSTRDWLSGQDAYTLHRPALKKFKHRPTIVRGPGVQLQADLMDVRSHSRHNDEVKFLLTAVDVFSRRGWAVPMRSKSAAETERALRDTFAGGGYEKLQTDKGTEFRNARVAAFLRDEGMSWFSTENEVVKASLVERFNKTLRKKIHAYLTRTRRGRYLDHLRAMVDAYNATPHRSLGMAPERVNDENAADIFVRLYEPRGTRVEGGKVKGRRAKAERRTPRFSVGDHVRTTMHRQAFDRGYTEQWTREIFVIDRVFSWESPVVYSLKDLAGEAVLGTYYEKELQKVKAPETFVIEEVLRSRGRGARREHLVKWLGYPPSFNSWVADADFVR